MPAERTRSLAVLGGARGAGHLGWRPEAEGGAARRAVGSKLAQLAHDARHGLGIQIVELVQFDLHDRRAITGREAHHAFEREEPVLACLAFLAAQGLFQNGQEVL